MVSSTKRGGVFVNVNRRPKLREMMEFIKAENGIVFNADLFYQAILRWYRELKMKSPKVRP